jgi:hypothetical protein
MEQLQTLQSYRAPGKLSFLSFWTSGLDLEELHFYPTCVPEQRLAGGNLHPDL